MTSYWLLIDAGEELSISSKYYKVAVSESVYGLKDFSILQQAARTHNWFLQKWSAAAALFIDKIAESLSVRAFQIPLQKKSCKCLVQSLKCSGQLPTYQSMPREARHLIDYLIPEVRINRQLSVIRRAEAEQRNKPKSKRVRDGGRLDIMNDRPSADGHQL